VHFFGFLRFRRVSRRMAKVHTTLKFKDFATSSPPTTSATKISNNSKAPVRWCALSSAWCALSIRPRLAKRRYSVRTRTVTEIARSVKPRSFVAKAARVRRIAEWTGSHRSMMMPSRPFSYGNSPATLRLNRGNDGRANLCRGAYD